MKKINKLITLGVLGVTAVTGGLCLTGCKQGKLNQDEALQMLSNVITSYQSKDFVISYEEDNMIYTNYYDADTKISKHLTIDVTNQQMRENYYWSSNGYVFGKYNSDEHVRLSRESWKDLIKNEFWFNDLLINETSKYNITQNGDSYTCVVNVVYDDVDYTAKWVYDVNQVLDFTLNSEGWSVDYDYKYREVDLSISNEDRAKESQATIDYLGTLSRMHNDPDGEDYFDFVATQTNGNGVYKFDSINQIGHYKNGNYEMYTWRANASHGDYYAVDSEGKTETDGLINVFNFLSFFGAYKNDMFGGSATQSAYIDINGNIVQTIIDGQTTSVYTYNSNHLVNVLTIENGITTEYDFDYAGKLNLTVPDSFKNIVA